MTQRVTGVQRYAREIVGAIDTLLDERGLGATMYVPSRSVSTPSYNAIMSGWSGFGAGHAWEQLMLPIVTDAPLLNLCNTAPLIRHRQCVCIHDANVFTMPESYGSAFRLAYRALLPLITRQSAILTTVSDSSARDLRRVLPIGARPIAVLPNGHEHVFRWSAARSTLFDDRRAHRPYVLLLGSNAAHKNLGLVLKLAEELDRLGLDIRVTGAASAIFAESSIAKAKNVIEVGYVDDDDLAALLSRALCLAFPSFTEGFGIPLVEAMALGCPVVSSDRASMPEVCGDAALLASPDDPQLWFSHIKSLMDSADIRQQCIERGSIQVQKFSWRSSAQLYINIMNEQSLN